MSIEKIGDGIWVAEGRCVNFHSLPFPTRCVIVRLADGDIWVWSPTELTAELQEAVRTLGTVRYLVSPNKIHHLFMGDWQKAFAGAELWGPASTTKKRDDLGFTGTLDDGMPDAWHTDLAMAHMRGSFVMDELVFFHKASRTTILADLSENFSEDFLRANWKPWQRRLARLAGVVEGKAKTPLDWRFTFWRRDKARKTRDTILGWPTKQVIMAHGTWQRTDGQAFLRKVFSWL
ncbi:DUF4336 domain-containing protein [Kordiimonas aestuarii]|uniref:DUF4336 domain-containing protein n=1 Tax=Kordiimonas aestuarii TaxID=1005925 RepID=UPI0021D36B1E|nr:DUF4336 domain-containing protein [Kordiimonas aestuarii]